MNSLFRRTSKPDMTESYQDTFFLPDLCRGQSVLFLVIMTELVALLFTLAQSDENLINWSYLGLLSLMGQWIVLSCAAILCGLRNYLSRHRLFFSALFSYAIILLVTLAYSILANYYMNLSHGSLGYHNSTLFLLKSMLMSLIIGGITLRYFYLQYHWRQQRQAELSARLQALQARIRPHFLFNSMNTIASLIAIDPETAEEAVLDLSELFRSNLDHQHPLIPLGEELELCRRYLHIEGLRMADRMSVIWKTDKLAEAVLIPPLTLQPLIENAIYHGIQLLREGGTITIECYLKKGNLYLIITNPYPVTEDLAQSKHKGNRIALSNIRSRLEALFDKQAVLKTSQIDGLFNIMLRFPARYKESAKEHNYDSISD